MSDELNEELDSQNQSSEEDVKTDVEDESAQEDSEDVEALKELNKKLYARAKKAEGFVLENGKWIKKPKPVAKTETQQAPKDTFDLEDVAVLVSQVPLKEDRDVVKKYAKVEGKTLEEALSDPIVKSILRERAETRKTAEATNTSGSKRTTPKVTDEQVIERFKEGKNVDPEALAEARMNLRKQQAKR